MSQKSNSVKAGFLGMPYGTAMGRLRKMVVFDLLKRHGENVCFRCARPIENVDALSIEHKQPWLNVDTKLFWDLENLAFSHLTCNRPDRPNGPPRKDAPPGTAWCSRHQKPVPISEFGRDPRKWNGVAAYCNPCRKEMRWGHDSRVAGKV